MKQTRNSKLKATSIDRANVKGKLYINSGYLKGRRLEVIQHDDLRPTLLANRQLLMNWLQSYHFTNALDLFSGSGSLALEVLSNHANHVVAVEMNYKVFQTLKDNFRQVQSELESHGARYKLVQGEALVTLGSLNEYSDQVVDLLLLDPPFSLSVNPSWVEKILMACAKQSLVARDAIIFLELDASFAWDEFLPKLQNKLVALGLRLVQLKAKHSKQVLVFLLAFEELV